MRQSLNYNIILEISFPYFRNDFKFCLFGQRFFFSIFIDLFALLSRLEIIGLKKARIP